MLVGGVGVSAGLEEEDEGVDGVEWQMVVGWWRGVLGVLGGEWWRL